MNLSCPRWSPNLEQLKLSYKEQISPKNEIVKRQEEINLQGGYEIYNWVIREKNGIKKMIQPMATLESKCGRVQGLKNQPPCGRATELYAP